ncbi:L-glutamate gamma-semialdehyde dehydrogenase [uncultured Gimesia sp.]|mgnify:CR=1 FL=1|uniref:L-glutamate gamma-semialdehyde dehydrogenase n=1 Tax=uncultured Gimesia sp. TaxID=1678688 RepID=UPI00262AFF62|nr:L-glutamate gamma-semialdehyde dehydrogenase [uncultured Gimesia sp.]
MAQKKSSTSLNQNIEQRTQELGQQMWDLLERREPSMFEKRWWDDRILSWAMADESVKVQMFRFVDVLPMLRSHESIVRHLHEYFEDVRKHLPWAVRIGLELSQPNSVLGRALALNARSNAQRMASRFIAGSSVEEVHSTIDRLRSDNLTFTLDLLGEAVISEVEAEAYLQSYLDLIAGLAPRVRKWSENVQLDWDSQGHLPRTNVSIKLSALCSQFKPTDPAGTMAAVQPRLRTLLRSAMKYDAYLHIDMEQNSYKPLTLEIFKQTLMEKEFRDFDNAGIVIQAYQPQAEQDLMDLLKWTKKRKTPIWIRLVKGAYWDYETITSQYHHWPIPVFQEKWESDVNFEKLSQILLKNYQWLRPAFGSHNMRSLANAIATAHELDVPPSAYEIQMLYGMGKEQAQVFAEMGHRVRIYTPFGELIPGMAYLVRRLLENTSNDSFLRQSFTEHVNLETLLMNPAKHAKKSTKNKSTEEPESGFQNEPLTDFSLEESRTQMQEALEMVSDQLGKEYPLLINGRAIDTKATITSRNPSHHSESVGTVCSASADDAIDAIDAARRAFPGWSKTEPQYRSEYLELIAANMRRKRFELAAWIVFECGKPWEEADGDVAEAIDFCMYYADQMRNLAEPLDCNVPGEENSYFYRPRGTVAVIAPWNFPLAILTGMTAAALVTGNTVVMKPAEQSSVVAAKLMDLIHESGIPDGVVNFLPGIGEEVGPELVGSPDVEMITFTGSRDVGLAIHETASNTDLRQKMVKRVIAEMGGKNPIIVDDDADLDEAVLGVMHSAFSYAGQKCSACSRVIVVESIHDAFVKRLIEATKSLKIGPAEDPGTIVGPVIDEEAQQRILEYIEIGKEEATLALACESPELDEEGYYVGPHIFTDVDASCQIAQDEIFGPVLAVMKAEDFEEAISIANDTLYALTAGIYSRSPAHLLKARQELVAGNIYLNRNITGAMVERHPFGGFKLSGIGSKTGGPDYLLQFLIPINITENTMRRGFAPTADGGDDEEKE